MKETDKEYRISFIGDVVIEYPVLREAAREDGSYDFSPALAPLAGLLRSSDYAVANLETPLGGEEAGYTPNIFSMNTPDSIVDALQGIGIDAVTTANNHMMDRGMEALLRTCRVLDDKGMAHTGTYDTIPEDRSLYFELGGTTVALLSYSVSANYASNRKKYDFAGVYEHANFLRPYTSPVMRLPEDPCVKETFAFFEKKMGRPLDFEERAELRRAMHQPVAFADDAFEADETEPFMEKLRTDYERARSKADIVIICPHTGGQFNTEPGAASRFFFSRMAQMGFDAVVAAHSHTTQRVWTIGSTLVAGCLGNVTMSPMTGYMSSVPETLSEYGMMLHIYISDKKLTRAGFSLFKAVQDESHPLRAVPVTELLSEITEPAQREKTVAEILEVCGRITGRYVSSVEEEWPLS
ncbi:MAG: CapA family protein [Lachnospiraceae bacterium]|nr:CapA family protein [Lachnospiraceae bacterium]